jgi:hypothetical protein
MGLGHRLQQPQAMNSIPFNSATPIPEDELIALRSIHETKRPSHWQGSKERVTPALLPFRFGDGKQAVLISFYSAPEVAIIILFDGSLPLDHDDLAERCRSHEAITSYREATQEIYDHCIDQWSEPPGITDYRRQQLTDEMEEQDPEDRDLWECIIKDGSTWCHA